MMMMMMMMMIWNPNGENIAALPYSTHSVIKVLMLLPYMSGNISLAIVDIFLQLGKLPELRLTLALVAPFARIEIVRKFSFPLTMSGLTRPIYKEKNAQMAALNNSALLGYWNREINFYIT